MPVHHLLRERGLRQKPYCAYNVLRAKDKDIVTITTTDYASGPYNCRAAGRELRKAQRKELKFLRCCHRQEDRSLRGRDNKRLANMRQRQEVKQMKYVHYQTFQRRVAACK